jgi:tripartite-type tricarboxylate transporter receptor subunit TctC
MRRRTMLVRALSWPIVLSLVAAACGGGGGGTAATGTAQPTLNWPTQPITLIVPFAAGGDTDVPMRVVAEFLGKELGQPVVVQNVAGGSGTTGTRQAKSAKPDGYTLVSIHEHTIINQHTGLVDYGPLDLEPIALLVTSAGFLATEVTNPWNDVKSLIEDAKKRPNEISWGVTFGSTAQMWAFVFMHKTGTQFRPVGYDGTAQRVTALLGKQIHLGETPLSTAQAQVKAGKLKLLGYAWTARDSRLPDVKTMKEQGVDAIFATSRGWAAPKGTPTEILKKLEGALQKVMANPEVKKKIEDEQGSIIEFLPREKYIDKLKQQDAELKKVIQETGMKAT